MSVKKAIVFNTISGFSKEMTATEFERTFRGNNNLNIQAQYPEQLNDLVVISDNGLKITHRASHIRGANNDTIPAAWVRPDGEGPQGHLFDRQRKNTGFRHAIENGHKVLLSLNMPDITSYDYTFENMQETGACTLKTWAHENRGKYISIPIHNAREAIDTINRVNKHGANLPDTIFAAYRGGVVPYSQFYLGKNKDRLTDLYNNLQNQHAGVPINTDRMVGFPRLFRFKVTKTTLDAAATQGLKGNTIKLQQGKPLFSQLIFKNEDNKLQTPAYQILTQQLLDEDPGIYVLASPSVSLNETHDPNGWKQLRWALGRIEQQTTPVSNAGKEKHKQFHANKIQVANTPAPDQYDL